MIADVEQELGVRLFDRSRRGVEATIYGQALIRRGKAAFDELRLGIQEIDYLRNEGIGEIRIGCPETIAASVLPTGDRQFLKPVAGCRTRSRKPSPEMPRQPSLRDRSIDLVLARDGPGLKKPGRFRRLHDHDAFRRPAECRGRREQPLGEGSGRSVWPTLRGAPWIVLPYGWGEDILPEAFASHGLPPPRIALKTSSIHLRLHLLATGSS